MFIPEPNGSNFTPPPAGNHVAICYRFIDLGTQMVEWKGTRKTQRKVLITWELPNELMTEGELAGKPFTIGQRYTWSMSEKSNLRHDLEAWRGKAFTNDDFAGPNRFNIKNIIGKSCMVNIVHSDKDGTTYANIAGVTPVPKGMTIPAAINDPVYFALDPPFFDASVLEKLSDKLKETIKSSPEFREMMNGGRPNQKTDVPPGHPDFDDEIPPF